MTFFCLIYLLRRSHVFIIHLYYFKQPYTAAHFPPFRRVLGFITTLISYCMKPVVPARRGLLTPIQSSWNITAVFGRVYFSLKGLVTSSPAQTSSMASLPNICYIVLWGYRMW